MAITTLGGDHAVGVVGTAGEYGVLAEREYGTGGFDGVLNPADIIAHLSGCATR